MFHNLISGKSITQTSAHLFNQITGIRDESGCSYLTSSVLQIVSSLNLWGVVLSSLPAVLLLPGALHFSGISRYNKRNS